MFNVCPGCGEYVVEKTIDPSGRARLNYCATWTAYSCTLAGACIDRPLAPKTLSP